jgi:hypothetical protein
MALTHLLKDLDEETYLHLSGLLQQRVECRRPFGFTKHTKPLLNRTQLILEVLVKRRSGHLLQGGFVLVNVGDPLLCNFILGISIGTWGVLALLSLHVKIG